MPEDASGCAGWARIDGLLAMPQAPLPVPEQQTRVWVSYSKDGLHVFFEAADDGRVPEVAGDKPYMNDEVEVYVDSAAGELVQVVADAAGEVFVKKGVGEVPRGRHGVTAQAKNLGTHGYCVALRIPWRLLDVSQPSAGMSFKANFCRIRRTKPPELSTWGAVERLFGEREHFGTLQLGRPIPGIGRFEDF